MATSAIWNATHSLRSLAVAVKDGRSIERVETEGLGLRAAGGERRRPTALAAHSVLDRREDGGMLEVFGGH
jgi:hypothetical protein